MFVWIIAGYLFAFVVWCVFWMREQFIIVWILVGYLIAFAIWYYFWSVERFFRGLEKVLDIIVEGWRLENPDGDIRDLRINVFFKDEQLELEKEDKNSEC